jgi:zinc transporter 1/2/3
MLIKSLYILGSFIVTILVGYIPISSKTFHASAKWTGIANAFAGGIFLGVGMMHLLPESNECLETYFPDQPISLAHFLMVLGYSLILFIEKIVTN